MTHLTLVVPTRNRWRYLQRLLAYFQAQQLPFPIVIADSSTDYEPAQKRDWLRQEFDRLQLKFSPAHADTGYFEKLLAALGCVETPFVAPLADDDFYVPQVLAEQTRFMEEHPAYAAVVGRALRFRVHPGPEPGRARLAWQIYGQRGFEQENVAQRLAAHAAGYTSNWYSLQRTPDLLELFPRVAAFKDDPCLVELFCSFGLVARGKIKPWPQLMLLREEGAAKEYPMQTLYARATGLWHSPRWELFTRTLSAYLVEQCRRSPAEADALSREALILYFGSQLSHTTQYRRELFRHSWGAFRTFIQIRRAYAALRARAEVAPQAAPRPTEAEAAGADAARDWSAAAEVKSIESCILASLSRKDEGS